MTWVNRRGERIAFADMNDEYLKNVARFMVRWAMRREALIMRRNLALLTSADMLLNGDMALSTVEDAIDNDEEPEDWHSILHNDERWWDCERELRRRKMSILDVSPEYRKATMGEDVE